MGPSYYQGQRSLAAMPVRATAARLIPIEGNAVSQSERVAILRRLFLFKYHTCSALPKGNRAFFGQPK